LGEPLRFQKKRRSTYVLWRFFCRSRRAIRYITRAAFGGRGWFRYYPSRCMAIKLKIFISAA
jgi:hypothetical protein